MQSNSDRSGSMDRKTRPDHTRHPAGWCRTLHVDFDHTGTDHTGTDLQPAVPPHQAGPARCEVEGQFIKISSAVALALQLISDSPHQLRGSVGCWPVSWNRRLQHSSAQLGLISNLYKTSLTGPGRLKSSADGRH